MKKFFSFILILVFVPFVSFAASTDIDAPNAIMVEASTGNVMWSKNAYDKAYPASTTKLMTAIVYYEKFKDDLDASITVDKTVNSTPSGSSIMGVKEGEVVTRRQLFYGLMLVSGNDAALVMAADHSGNVDEFVNLMNAKAKEYGMNSTHFANPHGFHNKDHYTTASDFAILARQYMKYDFLKEVAATKSFDLPATNKNEKRTLINSNRLISLKPEYKSFNYEYATGLKTGYTDAAKNCFVATAQKDGKSVIFVSFGSSSTEKRFSDAKKMLDYGLTSFSPVKIYPYIKDARVDIPIKDFKIPEYQYGKLDAMVMINSKEVVSVDNSIIPSLNSGQVTAKFSPMLDVAYPIKEGDKIGYIEYSIDGKAIYTATAVSTKYVAKRTTPKLFDSAVLIKNNQDNQNRSFLSSVLNMGIDLKKAA